MKEANVRGTNERDRTLDDSAPAATGQPRPPYQPPRIVDYGTVDDVTAGLSGAPGDDVFSGTVT